MSTFPLGKSAAAWRNLGTAMLPAAVNAPVVDGTIRDYLTPAVP
jgi:hypothetical protein